MYLLSILLPAENDNPVDGLAFLEVDLQPLVQVVVPGGTSIQVAFTK